MNRGDIHIARARAIYQTYYSFIFHLLSFMASSSVEVRLYFSRYFNIRNRKLV